MIALIVAGANNGELTDVKAYSQQQQLQQQQLGSKSKRQGQGDSTPDAAQVCGVVLIGFGCVSTVKCLQTR